MQASFWVKIATQKSRYGMRQWEQNGVPSCSKAKPTTKADEVAVKLTVEIPDSYFEVPELSAKIIVPESMVNNPAITPQVGHNLSKLIEKQLGLKVHLSVGDDEPEPLTKGKKL
jgi:hypothetical protein